ncbi:hypothetical protein FF2_033406 [Malus domestica]
MTNPFCSRAFQRQSRFGASPSHTSPSPRRRTPHLTSPPQSLPELESMAEIEIYGRICGRISGREPHENDTDGLASILSSFRRRLPSLAYVVLLHRLRQEGPCVVFWVGISNFKGERGCGSFRSGRASMIPLDRGDGDKARG